MLQTLSRTTFLIPKFEFHILSGLCLPLFRPLSGYQMITRSGRGPGEIGKEGLEPQASGGSITGGSNEAVYSGSRVRVTSGLWLPEKNAVESWVLRGIKALLEFWGSVGRCPCSRRFELSAVSGGQGDTIFVLQFFWESLGG